MRRVLGLLVALVALAVPASAGAAPPWQAAETVRSELFDAQSQLIIGGPQDAVAAVRRAQASAGRLPAGEGAARRGAGGSPRR